MIPFLDIQAFLQRISYIGHNLQLIYDRSFPVNTVPILNGVFPNCVTDHVVEAEHNVLRLIPHAYLSMDS